MPFKKIGLCDELVQGILATGYTAPTEIQAEAIPLALEGKDMIGCASLRKFVRSRWRRGCQSGRQAGADKKVNVDSLHNR